VRQLRNLIESMVVLAPEGRSAPATSRATSASAPAPCRCASRAHSQVAGQELEFIFRSLVELKMQMEDLRRRIEERPSQRVEVIEVGGGPAIDPLAPNPEP